MKLNPHLEMRLWSHFRKILGFMINEKGIEANPEKIQALLNMKSPTTIKEVQSLTRKVDILSHFVSWETNKCLIFFNPL